MNIENVLIEGINALQISRVSNPQLDSEILLSNSINKISVLNNLSFNNVEKFNLYNMLNEKKYHELYFNNGHLNKKGHDYLSKIIYDYIK